MTDGTERTGPERRAPAWMKVTLVLSLGLNILVAGLVVGAALGRDRDRVGDVRALRDLGRTPFVAALEPDDRRALGRAMMGQMEPLRANRAELRQRFEAFLSALRADPFDRETAERLIAGQRVAAAERQVIGEGLLLDRLAAMSAAERRAYADRLDRALRRRD